MRSWHGERRYADAQKEGFQYFWIPGAGVTSP